MNGFPTTLVFMKCLHLCKPRIYSTPLFAKRCILYVHCTCLGDCIASDMYPTHKQRATHGNIGNNSGKQIALKEIQEFFKNKLFLMQLNV